MWTTKVTLGKDIQRQVLWVRVGHFQALTPGNPVSPPPSKLPPNSVTTNSTTLLLSALPVPGQETSPRGNLRVDATNGRSVQHATLRKRNAIFARPMGVNF